MLRCGASRAGRVDDVPASFQVTFDAHDPARIAEFWAEVLGYILQPPPTGYATWEDFADAVGIAEEERGSMAAAVDPDGIKPRLLFVRVPEGKTVKNRVHLDVNVTDHSMPVEDRRSTIATHVDRLVKLGARKVEDRSDHTSIWTVMTDPEGNEFCLQ